MIYVVKGVEWPGVAADASRLAGLGDAWREIWRMAPEAILIFLAAASEEELYTRLQRRQTESEEQLRYRMGLAREEMRRMGEFDYVVVNRECGLDETVEQVLHIISAEHCRVQQRHVTL